MAKRFDPEIVTLLTNTAAFVEVLREAPSLRQKDSSGAVVELFGRTLELGRSVLEHRERLGFVNNQFLVEFMVLLENQLPTEPGTSLELELLALETGRDALLSAVLGTMSFQIPKTIGWPDLTNSVTILEGLSPPGEKGVLSDSQWSEVSRSIRAAELATSTWQDSLAVGGAGQVAEPSASRLGHGRSFANESFESCETEVQLEGEDGKPLDRTVRIWFGTDRCPRQSLDRNLGFSSEPDDQIHYGSCLVHVPKSHVVGSIGSGWFKRTFVSREDDRLTVSLIECYESPDVFQARIREELTHWPKTARRGMVFVHGYNVSFKVAALRAGQMHVDLNVPGVTAFYSWPSKTGTCSYSRDEEKVGLATDNFVEFLRRFAEINDLTSIEIIAHSMGNRLLANAIGALAAGKRPADVRVGNIVLAAPDVSRGSFGKVAHYYAGYRAGRTTIYSSSRDFPLRLSGLIHEERRVGHEPPMYTHRQIDTVSVSSIKTNLDLLGHGYLAASRPVIEDLKLLLWSGLPPAARKLTQIPEHGTPSYWNFV